MLFQLSYLGQTVLIVLICEEKRMVLIPPEVQRILLPSHGSVIPSGPGNP